MIGPHPMHRQERFALTREIADRALALYGSDLKAIGLYGSMARGSDGPFSDIEMFCVLRRPGEEFSYEWSYGPGKAEVDFYSADVLLGKAAEVEGRWPLTHGAFQRVLALHDPEDFFPILCEVARNRSAEQFQAAISGILVSEMYEFAGKLRNAPHVGSTAYVPDLAVQMAKYGAFVVGLHNRYCFTTGAKVLAEALTLPDRPDGLDALCRLVMSGDLADTERVVTTCEACWTGMTAWAQACGYSITDPRRIAF